MRIFLGLVPVLLVGCIVGEEAGSSPGEVRSALRPARPIPNNGLILDAELASRLPTTALGTRAADGTVTVAPEVAAQLSSPAGHALLKYAATCALPIDDTLVIGGDRYPGYYGLAPAWETGACDASCQRWVSACLLAHANQNGTPVQISLRGDNPAFTWEAEIIDSHTYQESAYFGNVFQRELYACIGTGFFDKRGSQGDTDYFLLGRICGLGGSCGLQSMGLCYSTTPELELHEATCETTPAPGAGYGDCHTLRGEGWPRTSPVFHEVVTVYLAP